MDNKKSIVDQLNEVYPNGDIRYWQTAAFKFANELDEVNGTLSKMNIQADSISSSLDSVLSEIKKI